MFCVLSIPTTALGQQVEVYGAAWCGPCRYVRAVLDKGGVGYRYHDVDTPDGRQRYLAARSGRRGIPLVVIGNTKIVGANIAAISSALSGRGIRVRETKPVRGGGDTYGGQPARWWTRQFRALQRRLESLDAQIRRQQNDAIDNVQQARVQKLRDDREMVQDAIAQLDADASRVSLPRKFRR